MIPRDIPATWWELLPLLLLIAAGLLVNGSGGGDPIPVGSGDCFEELFMA